MHSQLANHQLVNQTSGVCEYYSPPPLVDASRELMGGIDLDPASTTKANTAIVKADRFYRRPEVTVHYDDLIGDLPIHTQQGWGSLERQWNGNVWMNHPFGVLERACKPGCSKKVCQRRGHHLGADIPGNVEWVTHVINEYESGRVSQACILTFASTSEAWFKPLKKYPICFLDGRTNYLDPETLLEVNGVTKGSCVTYLGTRLMRFEKVFSAFGEVKVSLSTLRDLNIIGDLL